MRRSLSLSALAFVLLFSSVSGAQASVNAGSACKKVGESLTHFGKSFVCTKSGKKLVWVVKPIIKSVTTATSSAQISDVITQD